MSVFQMYILLSPPPQFKPPSNFILLIVQKRYFYCGSYCFVVWIRFLCSLSPMHVFSKFGSLSGRLLGNSCPLGLYDMISWYKHLYVILVFPHIGLWSGNFFLIAPFSDHCLLFPSYTSKFYTCIRAMKEGSSLMVIFIYLYFGTRVHFIYLCICLFIYLLCMLKNKNKKKKKKKKKKSSKNVAIKLTNRTNELILRWL